MNLRIISQYAVEFIECRFEDFYVLSLLYQVKVKYDWIREPDFFVSHANVLDLGKF